MTKQQFKKIGIFKCGNIATSPLLELLFDELADRRDIKVRTVTTGSKMGVEDVEEALPKLFEFNPDLLILTSPNTAMPGPAKVREKLSSSGLPSVVITDAPGKRVKAELENQGLGYIIVTGDPLIGARKEFLDSIEMAIFNSNIIKVLAITGAYRIVHQEIDKVIYALEAGQSPTLPRLIIDVNSIRDNSD
ncbi:MAG TPA: F420-dependent methylenetetrahydromethanopterin dehydrogenase, partial [Candidatus Bathyarchaeia archaeon]|nr:F420-dependent methylenetetrahydromethanopterin dehydrogenase [Candidatus Bathyarchaeia archaeon]